MMGEQQILAWLEENCTSLSLDSAEDRAVLAEQLSDYLADWLDYEEDFCR